MVETQAKVGTRRLNSEFARALGLFKTKQWTKALAAFVVINNDYPADGPTQFYIRYLQSLAKLPETSPQASSHVIDISHVTF